MSAGPLRHVYVHAPFCARRCMYCDFAVDVNRDPDGDAWSRVIRTEWEGLLSRGHVPVAERLSTLYVGGGTPSILPPSAVAGLAGMLGPERMSAPGLEWTVEANPESFTTEVADVWASAGVNRISFGVQSFDPLALGWMGRLHSPDQALEAVGRARAAGVRNVSIDLIFGLPVSVSRSWRFDLERALELDVPHVSLYGLSVEEGTPLHRRILEGRTPEPSEDRYRDEFLMVAETMTSAGYRHYEVSNFARAGYESKHNLAYWEHVPYLGLGNGAHSYHGRVRRWNLRDWGRYAQTVLESGDGTRDREVLSAPQIRLERAWLGLRTANGVESEGFTGAAADLVGEWTLAGLASEVGGRVRLTPSGWLSLDRLAVELDEALAGAERPTYR